jgi:hypothetical protein
MAVTRAQADQLAGLVLRQLAQDAEQVEGDLTQAIVRIVRRVLNSRPQAQAAAEALLNEIYQDRFGVDPRSSPQARHKFMHWMLCEGRLSRAEVWEATDEGVS